MLYITHGQAIILRGFNLFMLVKEAPGVDRETVRWRHDAREDVSNHRRLDSLLNCLFRHRS